MSFECNPYVATMRKAAVAEAKIQAAEVIKRAIGAN